jgi:Flp pilus assembly protein TadB
MLSLWSNVKMVGAAIVAALAAALVALAVGWEKGKRQQREKDADFASAAQRALDEMNENMKRAKTRQEVEQNVATSPSSTDADLHRWVRDVSSEDDPT